MNKYEVVIIGAGPGGLNCAKILGDAGKKVLLLEKNQEIGPKVCAGGLTRKSYQYLMLPENLIGYKFDKIYFNATKVKTAIKFLENFFLRLIEKNWASSRLIK